MFDKHLKESETTYFAHLIWAVKAGFILIFTGIVSIIHGLLPNVASEYTAKKVIYLYHERLRKHPNKAYQDFIDEQSKKQ